MLMLMDDSGEVQPVKLDPALVTSDNAIIVLDEYGDTCWVFIGRNVSMPTRMHALRIGKSMQKSGYKIGITTIGLASTNLVEMLEKDDSDPDVATSISRFREQISRHWNFEDKFLAIDASLASSAPMGPIAGAPTPKSVVKETPVVTAETVKKETSSLPKVAPISPLNEVERKTAFLLYAAIKNSDLIYVERFSRNRKMGVKIEAPGEMVIEAVQDGPVLKIDPPGFGDSETAAKTKEDFKSWA
ncbi:MAG: hypothetical protein EAX81_00695 [Candidatus Thorarchaeota archaeon]|nr:hypothetical protein [Candidatus Thorarchaeota archaeon]